MKFILLILLLSCRPHPSDISIIGLNDNGESIERKIPLKRYSRKVGRALNQLQMKTNNVLESVHDTPSWALKRVDVGLAMNWNFGLKVVAIDTTAAMRLTFKKKEY